MYWPLNDGTKMQIILEQFEFRVMVKECRKWSQADTLHILQEVEQNGLRGTLPKYSFSQSLFLRWRRACNGQGMEGLKPT